MSRSVSILRALRAARQLSPFVSDRATKARLFSMVMTERGRIVLANLVLLGVDAEEVVRG